MSDARAFAGRLPRLGGALLAGFRNRAQRIADFCLTPKPAIVPPFRGHRAPLERLFRKSLMFAAIIFLGMVYGFFYALFPPALLIFLIAPLGVLALIVIWSLPDRDTLGPVGALHKLFFAYWFVSVIWPNYLAVALPGLPWISFERLTLAPMTLVLLIIVSTSAPFRRQSADALRASPVITRMMLAYIAVQVASIPFSSNPFSTMQRFMDIQFTTTVVFFATLWLFLQPGNVTRWVRMMIGMAIVTAIIGIIEYRYERVLWADSIPSFLQVNDEAVQRTLAGSVRGGKYRANSTFSVSLPFAEYLALTTPFVIHLFTIARRNAVRLACVAIDALLLWAVLITGARLGMVGFVFSHAVYGLIWGIRKWRSDRSSLVGPSVTLAYPAILAVVALGVMTIGRLRNVVIGDGSQNASNDAREAQFELFWPELARAPLGHGPGQSGETLGFANAAGVGTVDSYVITIGMDYGVLGLLLFFGLILVGMATGAKIGSRKSSDEVSYAHPVAIALGAFLLIKLVLSQEDNTTIFFMMIGMLVALNHRLKSGEAAEAEPG